MRALLLAAGLGTRLRPLTNTVPKCLVPLMGKPLLQIWFERLSEAGIGPFLVNTHHLANQVEAFVASSSFNGQVTLVHEPMLLNTAGTLLANLDYFDGQDGLLIHSDNYCEADFREFVRAHEQRPAECLMTMMTFRTDDPTSCGILELDDRGVVIGFHEKVANPPGDLANSAIYILSVTLLEKMADEFATSTDFSKEVIPKLIGRIHTYQTNETFADIGSNAAYDRLLIALK